VRSAGILLIVAAAFVVYAVVHGRLAPPAPSSSASSGGGGGGGSSSAAKGGSAQPDSGTHQAVDLTGSSTGTVGAIYTVSSTYGAASAQDQDNMNAFAHQIGNVG
jgi:hypothetical protein